MSHSPTWLEDARRAPAEVRAKQLDAMVNDPHALGAAVVREANALATAADAVRKAVDSDAQDASSLAEALVEQFALFDQLARFRALQNAPRLGPSVSTSHGDEDIVLADWKQLFLTTGPHAVDDAWWTTGSHS